jgi:hypothetical protein
MNHNFIIFGFHVDGRQAIACHHEENQVHAAILEWPCMVAFGSESAQLVGDVVPVSLAEV